MYEWDEEWLCPTEQGPQKATGDGYVQSMVG